MKMDANGGWDATSVLLLLLLVWCVLLLLLVVAVEMFVRSCCVVNLLTCCLMTIESHFVESRERGSERKKKRDMKSKGFCKFKKRS